MGEGAGGPSPCSLATQNVVPGPAAPASGGGLLGSRYSGPTQRHWTGVCRAMRRPVGADVAGQGPPFENHCLRTIWGIYTPGVTSWGVFLLGEKRLSFPCWQRPTGRTAHLGWKTSFPCVANSCVPGPACPEAALPLHLPHICSGLPLRRQAFQCHLSGAWNPI